MLFLNGTSFIDEALPSFNPLIWPKMWFTDPGETRLSQFTNRFRSRSRLLCFVWLLKACKRWEHLKNNAKAKWNKTKKIILLHCISFITSKQKKTRPFPEFLFDVFAVAGTTLTATSMRCVKSSSAFQGSAPRRALGPTLSTWWTRLPTPGSSQWSGVPSGTLTRWVTI